MSPVVLSKHVGSFASSGIGESFVVLEGWQTSGYSLLVGTSHYLVDCDRGAKAEDMKSRIVDEPDQEIEGEHDPHEGEDARVVEELGTKIVGMMGSEVVLESTRKLS